MKRILIIGATSAIAEATAREFARRGDSLFLVARNGERLQAVAEDLKVRGALLVLTFELDARQIERYPSLLEAVAQQMGEIDVALIAHGTLSDQSACQASVDLLLQEFTTNALSYMALCTLLANGLEAQGHGVLALISSVAGDRGRQSNYVYGLCQRPTAATVFKGCQRGHHQTRLRQHTDDGRLQERPPVGVSGDRGLCDRTCRRSRHARALHALVLETDHGDHKGRARIHIPAPEVIAPPDAENVRRNTAGAQQSH